MFMGLAALSACNEPEPLPPPPPPPVVVVAPVYVPRAPLPPLGASATMAIPTVRGDGLRQTVNRDLGPLETLWHVRSGFNVAALNCQGAKYQSITTNYNLFLKRHKSALRNANNAINRKFRRENGGTYRTVRDRHLTSVYNFFSFPPLKTQYCDKMLTVGKEIANSKSKDIKAFAGRELPKMEKIFVDFYVAYEEYQKKLEAWRAKYGKSS